MRQIVPSFGGSRLLLVLQILAYVTPFTHNVITTNYPYNGDKVFDGNLKKLKLVGNKNFET